MIGTGALWTGADAHLPRMFFASRSQRAMVWSSVLLGVGAAAVQVAELVLDLGMWDETLAWILGGGAVAFASFAAASSDGVGPRARCAWIFWGIGALLLVIGPAVAGGFIVAGGSVSRMAYLPWLGFAVCGVAGLAFRSSRGPLAFPLFVLDAIPLMLAAVAFMRPDGQRVEWGGLFGQLVALAFPALFVLLALVAMEVALLERRHALDSVSVAAVGFVFLAVACIVWVSPVEGGFGDGQWADALWTCGSLVVAAAGCRVGLNGRDSPMSDGLEGDSGARAFLPLAGVGALGLMLVEEYGRYHALVWATIAAVLVLAARFIVSRRAADAALGRERGLRADVEQARRQISDQNDSLLELDRIKEGLIATVSHELRTPLTAIRGYLQIVTDEESGALNEEQQAFLAIVTRNVDRLGKIVNDLLFVAQSDAGKLVLDKEAIDLHDIVVESVAAVTRTAEAKGIVLIDHGVPTRVVADRSRLAQVLDNLLSNAVKFTPDGGSVQVTAGLMNGAAVLSVTDTGMGMSPKEQERLFDRFYRTETASKQAIPGTGLGLSIAKVIVDAHDGKISVESRQDMGTTFLITLPAGVDEASQRAPDWTTTD